MLGTEPGTIITSVSYYYPSSLALTCSPFHNLTSSQRFTLDYYTQSMPHMYSFNVSSSFRVNEVNFRCCFSNSYVTQHKPVHITGIQNAWRRLAAVC